MTRRRTRRELEKEIEELEDEVGADEEKGSLVKALVRMHEREKAEAAEDDVDREGDE
ncbi:hypothetical protein [Halopelagius fulvigenes]|uniref:Uncharacterized protein n=1 Tax=Halopelagius fulvigenes TaxID=1198324 RepID=A0ABD5TW20_9EURY